MKKWICGGFVILLLNGCSVQEQKIDTKIANSTTGPISSSIGSATSTPTANISTMINLSGELADLLGMVKGTPIMPNVSQIDQLKNAKDQESGTPEDREQLKANLEKCEKEPRECQVKFAKEPLAK